jgi:arylsulfatase A-like enzyme
VKAPLSFLLYALWFGLTTGVVEVAILAARKVVLHRLVFFGPDIVWMSPLMDALLFVAVGLVLLAASRVFPTAATQRFAILVFAFLAILAQLLKYPRLHWAAALVLAAGTAFQASRLLGVREARFKAFVRRSTPWLVAVLAILATSAVVRRARAEERANGAPPPIAGEAPSVLLVVLDTVRSQSLGVQGYPRATSPQLDRLARQGARFANALATAPWTTPSHRSLFTGLFPFEFRKGGGTPAGHTTLADVLRARGYLTAGFVANVELCGSETGLSRGFAHYEDYRVSLAELVLSASLTERLVNNRWTRRLVDYHDNLGRKTAPDVNRAFLAWLDEQGPRHPFFAFLNYYDTHEPYLPPEPFASRFGSARERKNALIWHHRHQGARLEKEKMSAREIQGELDAYEGSIAYLDDQMGALLEELRARGRLQNTVLVVTSDHGEQFGEHGLFTHKNSLYRQVLQVPLVISFPSRVPAAVIVDDPVTLRDVAATILDLLAVPGRPLPGSSLTRFWSRAGEVDSAADGLVLSELGADRSLVRDGYHFIQTGDGEEALYDFSNDPLETRDLDGSPQGRRVEEGLKAFLDRTIGPPGPVPEEDLGTGTQ